MIKKKTIFVLLVILLVSILGCDSKKKFNNIDDKKDDNLEEKVKDTIAPLLTLTGDRNMIIEVGTEVDLKTGLIGMDNIEKIITSKISIDDGGFDNNKVGKYTIIYNLKDSDGNEAEEIMRTITVIDSKNAKLVAHRGGKGAGLENTKEAFQNAIKKGYYGVECDIQPTKDKKLILWHDLTFASYGYDNTYIKDMNYDDIKNYVLTKNETDGNTYTGKILLFSEFLSLIKNSGITAFIELKESNNQETVNIMIKEINESGIDYNKIKIIANSASIDLLVYIRSINNTIKLQFVGRTEYQKYMQTCIDNKIDLDVSYTVFDENYNEAISYVDLFHENNLEVNIWVINKETILKKFLVIGADYITTDTLLPYNE